MNLELNTKKLCFINERYPQNFVSMRKLLRKLSWQRARYRRRFKIFLFLFLGCTNYLFLSKIEIFL